MFFTALVLGFAGSLHCMGMCSPLAISVTKMSSNVILGRILYNLGRIVTYGILGGIVSTIGLGFPMIKYQNLISILLGISLVVIGFAGVSFIRVPVLTKVLGSFSVFLKNLFSKFLQRKSYLSTFTLGSLNGILPCGLSFLALTYCVTLKGPANGFVFMSVFGIGTLPVMLGFTSVFYWVIDKFNVQVKSMTTGLLILSGLLLIGRVFFVHFPHTGSIQQGVVDIVVCR
jgi:uncharacterized protein